MKTISILNIKFLAIIAMFLGGATFVHAQGRFDPAITVNTDAITQYEIDQRAKFLRLTGRRGKLEQIAEDSLIDNRLQMQAARRNGIQLSEDALTREMEAFAQRANLDLPRLLDVLRAAQIDEATLRDFVEVNVTWREVVRSRFNRRGQVSDAEIDRALNAARGQGGLRVLYSEIILAARPNEIAGARRTAARLANIRSTGTFSAEARKLSIAPSKNRGGKVDWTNVSDLPPALRPILLNLKPGQVSEPIEGTNAIFIFQLRDVQEIQGKPTKVTSLEYATFTANKAEVVKILPRVDVCDDLYGIAKKFNGIDIERKVLPPADIPQDIQLELSKLDANEVSIVPGQGQNEQRVTMLCGRTSEVAEDVSREEIAGDLRQRRLSSLAQGYLEELRSKAVIVYK